MLRIIPENEKMVQNVFFVLSVLRIVPRMHCKLVVLPQGTELGVHESRGRSLIGSGLQIMYFKERKNI